MVMGFVVTNPVFHRAFHPPTDLRTASSRPTGAAAARHRYGRRSEESSVPQGLPSSDGSADGIKPADRSGADKPPIPTCVHPALPDESQIKLSKSISPDRKSTRLNS